MCVCVSLCVHESPYMLDVCLDICLSLLFFCCFSACVSVFYVLTSVFVCLFCQSNVNEAAPDMKRESEKEWYFGNADKERRGPFSFK